MLTALNYMWIAFIIAEGVYISLRVFTKAERDNVRFVSGIVGAVVILIGLAIILTFAAGIIFTPGSLKIALPFIVRIVLGIFAISGAIFIFVKTWDRFKHFLRDAYKKDKVR